MKGIVEYVDKQEEMLLHVGVDASVDGPYTHYELHASLQNGLCASMIPFPGERVASRAWMAG